MVSKMKNQIKPAPILHCNQCGVQMERPRFSSGRLMDLGLFMKRKFCSKECQDKSLIKQNVTNGQHRYRARKHKKSCCELCSSQKNLQVHHKDKDITNNQIENLQTLCASCHNTLHWQEKLANGN